MCQPSLTFVLNQYLKKMETVKPRKRIKSRIRYGKYLFEAFTILFGVLLGFLVNQWRESLQQQKELSLSTVRIHDEIYSNALDIVTILEQTDTTLDKLNQLQKLVYSRKNRTMSFANFDLPTVQLTTLKTDNWEAFRTKGLGSYMPVEQLAALTNLYDNQNFILKINTQFISQMASIEYFKPQNRREAWQVTVGLVVYLKELQKNVLKMQLDYFQKFDPENYERLNQKAGDLLKQTRSIS